MRLFWPYWAGLGLMAVFVQWMVLRYVAHDYAGHEARSGALTPVALFWPIIYAFAVGATAFAGERENRTLGWLDTLPVDRRTLWVGKASFAVGTTLAMGTVLVLMSMMGTTLPRTSESLKLPTILLGLGPLAVEAAAWGLLWSALLGNTMIAAILAIVSVGLISSVLYAPDLDHLIAFSNTWRNATIWGAALRLMLAAAAAAVSYRAITARPRPGRSRSSPLSAIVSEARPIYASTLEFSESSRRTGVAATFGRLVWETAREGGVTMTILAVLGLFFSAMQWTIMNRPDSLGICALFGILLTLAAGVSVFAPANRGRTFRFFVHHGVRPAQVWLVKEVFWIGAVAAAWVIALAVFPDWGRIGPRREEVVVTLISAVLHAFALGQLCGLVIRRGITAGLVALLLMFLVFIPQIGLTAAQMVPAWSALIVPAILLAISFAWAGDWMLDRPGARRWVRLAVLTVVPFGLLFSGYVAFRAWGVPDRPFPFDPIEARPAPIPPDQDAAEGYRAAIAKIRPVAGYSQFGEANVDHLVIDSGWNPDAKFVVDYWRANREAIDLAREASSRPRGWFAHPSNMTIVSTLDPALAKVRELARLLALDARERQSRGDLPGAWGDIHAAFRMAEVVATSAPLAQMLTAYGIDTITSRLAISWAVDPRQTAATLRAALDDLRRLAPLPSLAETLKVETLAEDRTIDLPMEELMDQPNLFGRGTTERALTAIVALNPWERERAHRVLRLLSADDLALTQSESWQYWKGRVNHPPSLAHWRNPSQPGRDPSSWTDLRESTPLIRIIHPNWLSVAASRDQGLTLRRALEQVLALRLWQAEHGSYPDTLDQLVPSMLPSLPLDPYSGRPFGYVASKGQDISPMDQVGRPSGVMEPKPLPTRPGQMLLFSVGPDGEDNGARMSYEGRNDRLGDVIFALPDREPGPSRPD